MGILRNFDDFPDLDNPVTFNYNSELHFITMSRVGIAHHHIVVLWRQRANAL